MFFKLINLIKINILLKNKIIKIKLYKNDFKILKIFLKLNIIKNLKKCNNNKYILVFNNNNNFNNIINLYKPSNISFIKLKNIIKINRKKPKLFYISTNKGVINNFEAEKLKVGGVLVFSIQL